MAPIKTIEAPDSNRLFDHNNIGQLITTLQGLSEKQQSTTSESESSSSQSAAEPEPEEEVNQQTQDEEILSRHHDRMQEFSRSATELNIQIYVRASACKQQDLPEELISQLYKDGNLKYKISAGNELSKESIENRIALFKIREIKERVKFITTTEFKKMTSGPEILKPNVEEPLQARPQRQAKPPRKHD